MVEEDSEPSQARTRRWWVWALALALVVGVTAGGLAWASSRSAAPFPRAPHTGNLSDLPDEAFFQFLPTREDFPKRQLNFLALTAEDIREHPEPPSPPMDPPACDPMSPLRNITMLGEVRAQRALATSYTVGVTRESLDDNLVADVGKWLASCPEVALPSASNDQETRQRKAILEKLPDPPVGADRVLSYVITVVDKSADDPKNVLYPPETDIMTVSVTRGVGLFVLAKDTLPEKDAKEREWLLSRLTARIRQFE